MRRVFGIETEYGITVDGADDIDVVAESIALVRTYAREGAHMKWDYRREDPHRDARGFRAKELLQDTDEAGYVEVDRKRPLSFEEIKSDVVLSNGARFYNDHAHPEYSTPECTTLREIVAQDKAGERILAECARRRNLQLPEGQRVRLYKNNTDFSGHSYGCHDNYLVQREVPFHTIVARATPFLVTRQIFAGAGKIGFESESGAGQPGLYQISQRSDFFSELVSIDTMNRRPLVNTRDEPHADPSKYRRFHVIIGDANMNEWATAMKIGTTALVLDLIERGEAPAIALYDPVDALRAISRDQDYNWMVKSEGGQSLSAIDVQRLYLEAARKSECGMEERGWILHEWEKILDDLEQGIGPTADRIDWVAKKSLLSSLQQEENLSWNDPWLQAIDLQYHDIDPETGFYFDLVRQRSTRHIVSEDEIRRAMKSPPATTRAFVRGRAVALFGPMIESLQWEEIVFRELALRSRVKLSDPFLSAETRKAIHASHDLASFISASSA